MTPDTGTQQSDINATSVAIQPLIGNAVQAEKEVVALVHAYKAGGIGAVAALLPALVPEVEKDYADVKAALPAIKHGFKTSEFWIVVGVDLFIAVMTALGKVPPLDGSMAIAGLTGIFSLGRSLLKSSAQPAK